MSVHALELVTVISILTTCCGGDLAPSCQIQKRETHPGTVCICCSGGFSSNGCNGLGFHCRSAIPVVDCQQFWSSSLAPLAGDPGPSSMANHILSIIVLLLVIWFVNSIYRKWNGAYSARQREKQRYREPMPLLAEGLFEASRIIARKPPLEIDIYERKPGPAFCS